MIKNWNLFLEAFDPFEGDSFREEILNNVNDILSVLKDDGIEIHYNYGICNVNVFPGTKPHNELQFIIHSGDKEYINSDDFQSVIHLHNYLVSEGFDLVSDNKPSLIGFKELSIQFHIKNKILSYPISRLKWSIEKGLKADWIKFSYKLPFEKWKGNYTSKK